MAVSKSLRYQILRRDNHTCRYCGRSAPEVKLTVDHVVAEALGGRDEPTNLVTACADCNTGKSATPADAALVDQVADDAIRWSRAIAAAADEMLEDLDARNASREEFLENWQRWTVGSRKDPVPLPADWANTVDRFVAAGLPLPILIDCAERALANQKVRADQTFRYMCGIAWKRVTELQEAARVAVAPAPPADPWSHRSYADALDEFASILQERLSDDQREAWIKRARADLRFFVGEIPETENYDVDDARYHLVRAAILMLTGAS